MLDIGQKLRSARVSQRLSLRELATRADVSASLLSQIENGKANPSVRSLYSIAEALSLSVDHFFGEKEDDEVDPLDPLGPLLEADMTASEVRTAQAVTTNSRELFAASHKTKGPITRVTNRATIELEGGVTWTRLTPGPEEKIEFLEVCYNVGATSGQKMSHHTAREFGQVLAGVLQVELGFEKYLLQAGDTIIFDSTTPHRLTNVGDTPMRAIWVIFRPT
ncbi:MAG: cupin domain-containing protein [Anaerolineae bacterium]|nr:cupin domain-containing protein [Anaerolineae bacterium]